ncbi:MAG TPA: DUF4124 domain-containing protein [Xanthomonadaceae bacterium]|nr:DUF4124 domain-containing protein [Xanthomonadaceae bacterium]
MKRQRGNARLYSLAVVLALAAAAAWLWFEEPDSLPPWARPQRAAPEGSASDPATAPPAGPARPVYRWRDDAGVLQITDRPPQGRPYETVRIDPETNVVPSILPPGYEGYAEPGDDEKP